MSTKPISYFTGQHDDDEDVLNGKPSVTFRERAQMPDVVFVQFARSGARVIHAAAHNGDCPETTAPNLSIGMSPRRLGPARSDTVGKGDKWLMDHAVHL